MKAKKAIAILFSFIISLVFLGAQEVGPATTPKEKKLVEAPSANTNVQQGPSVKEIQIEYVGPKSVNRSVILSNMRTTIGQPYSPAAVEEDIRNLYATGFFTNLRITDEPLGDGVKVVVIVQPKPLIKEIVINGAKKLDEKRVRKEVKSKVGDALSEQQISEDSDKIKELYRNKGFSRAEITYKVDVNEEFGRAVVTFSINESVKGYVTEIKFIGNKNLTTEELQKVLKTKEKDWLTWITKSGVMKEEQFKDDKQKLKEHYQSKGYIDMEIKDVKNEYPKEGELILTITVFEGIQYKVGTVGFKGNQLFNDAQIRARLKMGEAGVYSPQGMEADVKAIKDLYGEKGYIDANVNPERQANVESGRIDLVYSLNEGPQSFVDKIVIQGNNKTKDKVLRREVALAPGDVYDSVRGDASKSRLQNLGYFEKVDISSQDTNIPNRKNMVVTVEEKRTGSVTFGAGFSSVESLLGFVEFQQGNFDIQNFPYFTGAGQKFRARVQYGLKRKDLLLSFTEPWFMNQRLSLGFDIFASQKEYLSSLYNQQ
ncbi:MAG: outer membrane protein assembly factor BamA, partial [Verrucomicrobiota bacterium]